MFELPLDRLDSVYELGSSIDRADCCVCGLDIDIVEGGGGVDIFDKSSLPSEDDWCGGLDKGDDIGGGGGADGRGSISGLNGGGGAEGEVAGGGGGGAVGEEDTGDEGPLPKAFLAACSAKDGL